MKPVCELQSFNNFEKALDALILESKQNGICSEELYTALDIWIDLEIADKMDGEFTSIYESRFSNTRKENRNEHLR